MACLVAVLATLLVIGWNHGRSLRRCLRALVDTSASSIGDPLPSVVAAERLAHRWRAPIYEDFSVIGSSFVYPPIAALPYTPLAAADEHGIRAGLAWCSRAAWLLCLWFALRLVGPRATVVRAGLLVWGGFLFHPLLQAVYLNQASLFVAASLGAGVVLAERRRVAVAGVLCAFAAAWKPHLACVPLLVLLCDRRFAVWAFAASGVLGVVSLAYAGFDNHWRYLTVVLPQLADGYAFHPNQSWNAFFLRLGGAPFLEFELAPSWEWTRAASLVVTAVVLVTGAWVLRAHARRPEREGQLPLVILFAWLVATLASPVSWEHHYVPALFVFAWLLREALGGRASRATVVLAALAAPAIAGYVDVRSWSLHPVAVVAMSYVLWGGLLLAVAVASHLLRRPVPATR